VAGSATLSIVMKRKTQFISQTALMLALLICIQYMTKAFGQFVTGSCVNLILAITAVICGLEGGLLIALISPILAFMLGIGPSFIQIVICIAISNCIYVCIIFFGLKKSKERKTLKIASILIAAIMKFITIYFSVVVLLMPSLGLGTQQFDKMALMFSWPQLVTAIIGSFLMLIIKKPIENAMKSK